jgi:hypothetical protein
MYWLQPQKWNLRNKTTFGTIEKIKTTKISVIMPGKRACPLHY